MRMPVSPRWRSSLPLIFLAAIPILYFFTLTSIHNHTEAEDSLYYLIKIDRAPRADLFTRDHLVFLPLNRAFLQAWRAFGYSGKPELPVCILGALAGLAGLAVMYALLRALEVARRLRILSVMAVAFSYAYWLYSGQVATYVMPLALALGCVYFLVRVLRTPSSTANPVWLGILSGAAILIHGQHSLLAVVIVGSYVLLFIRNRAVMSFGTLVKSLLIYCGVYAGVVLASYTSVMVAVKGLRSAGPMMSWMFQQSYLSVGQVSVSSLAAAVVGLSRAILGTHYLFSFPQVVSAAQRIFPSHNLREEIFLVRAFPRWEGVMLGALTMVLLLCLAVALIEVVRKRSFKVLYSSKGGLPASVYCAGVALIYLVTYSIFNIWWEAVNPQFWISVLPILGVLSALLLNGIFNGKIVRIAVTLAVILIFAINLVGAILPQMDPNNDYWFVSSRWFIDNCRAGDLVVTGAGYASKEYIEYYSGAEAFDTALPLPEAEIWNRYQLTVERVRPKRILVSSTMLSPSPEYLRQFGMDATASTAMFERMKPFLTVVHSDSGETIYQYSGPKD